MVQRLVEELEGAVLALGETVRSEHPDWYEARFGEFYDGGLAAFGARGPGPAARLDAELWFLLDCPLDLGEVPLHRAAARPSGRAVALLARSELRAWRVESVEDAGVLVGLCPLGTGGARLETARAPLGDLRRGRCSSRARFPSGLGAGRCSGGRRSWTAWRWATSRR